MQGTVLARSVSWVRPQAVTQRFYKRQGVGLRDHLGVPLRGADALTQPTAFPGRSTIDATPQVSSSGLSRGPIIQQAQKAKIQSTLQQRALPSTLLQAGKWVLGPSPRMTSFKFRTKPSSPKGVA